MSIEKFCRREVVTATRDMSVAEAARLMRETHVGDVVVIDGLRPGTRPVGMLTDRDIVLEVVAAGLDPASVKVGDLLCEPLVTVSGTTGYVDTVRIMAEHGIRRLPVVTESGDLVGIVTLDDLLALVVVPLADLAGVPPRERRREVQRRP